ncbi:hypothetical protein D3C80_1139670 [compost metagenome]
MAECLFQTGHAVCAQLLISEQLAEDQLGGCIFGFVVPVMQHLLTEKTAAVNMPGCCMQSYSERSAQQAVVMLAEPDQQAAHNFYRQFMRCSFARQRIQAKRPVAVQAGSRLPVLQQHGFQQHGLRFLPGLLPFCFRKH